MLETADFHGCDDAGTDEESIAAVVTKAVVLSGVLAGVFWLLTNAVFLL